ncbi:hypothetical protein TNCV_131291 [Trichonephila clavipes]|nr:hypothetical protein TNCV_131291 [Trichonephila clavipes]
MKRRPISEFTPLQGEAEGRKRPYEYETKSDVTRARGVERRKGGLNSPKTRSRNTKTQWGERMLLFFRSWYEKEKESASSTFKRNSRWNEAGVSLNTDPSSDEKQRHLNIVKYRN